LRTSSKAVERRPSSAITTDGTFECNQLPGEFDALSHGVSIRIQIKDDDVAFPIGERECSPLPRPTPEYLESLYQGQKKEEDAKCGLLNTNQSLIM
jgi:hypothetical protein